MLRPFWPVFRQKQGCWRCQHPRIIARQKIFSPFLQFILDILPLGTKIPVEAALFAFPAIKTKKPRFRVVDTTDLSAR
nr:MAG TPA: hypothetical protein [Caudoviricetes sp.]